MATAKKRKKRKSAKRVGEPGRVSAAFRRLGRAAVDVLVGRELDEETHSHLQELVGLVLIGFALWLGVSMLSFYAPFGDATAGGANWGGQVGHYLASCVLLAIGWSGYLLVFLLLAWGAVLMGRKEVAWPGLRIVGGLCFLLASAFLLQLAFGESFLDRLGPGGPAANRLPYGPGGWLALELVGPSPNAPTEPGLLVEKFGGPGLWILLLLTALVSFGLATELAFWPALVAFGRWLGERREASGESPFAAVAGWSKRMLASWWEFLRGADLDAEPQVELAPQPKRSRAKQQQTTPEPEPVAEAEADEAETEDDGEWEYEYEDDEAEGEGEAEGDEEWEEEPEDEDAWEEEPVAEDEEPWEDEAEPAQPKRKAGKQVKAKTSLLQPLPFDPPTPPPGPWKFPPIDLLEPPDAAVVDGTTERERIEKEAVRLEHALHSFRVEAHVVGSTVGPAVTLYELEVASGTRMNKVTTLAQEIAAALRARSIRIIAPIPGRSTIGIEVPNARRRVVRFSELLTKDAYDPKRYALPLFLGMDAEGKPVVEDLARMPHLLIAGTTGSGKSVCINTIIASLLLTRSPHDVKTIMVDPKMVELQMFSDLPHQMCPVVTDMKQATNVLLWAVEKMEGRYELFKDAGVRNIKGYNALGEKALKNRLGDKFSEERTPRHVPYIVVVIDEMADLMIISKKEAEQAITRLAQKSRAVGIHVIVATQRPSTDVITGVLKGNLPTRVAFQVASKIDSRVILDTSGAEKLLGQGDMLYNPPQSSQIKRVQGALVEDHELQSLVEFVCQESAPSFSQELIQAATGATRTDQDGPGPEEQDDLWNEAVRVVLKSRRGSASLLQRALGIGYTRASRLIDIMRDHGIVGTHKGSKASEVLLTLEEWEGESEGALEDEPAETEA